MNFLRNLNFFNGFMYGFIAMWLMPNSAYNKIAFFYYDMIEPDDESIIAKT